MSYKRVGTEENAYSTPVKRSRTSFDTPGSIRSTASYRSRLADTPSAYDTFPAQEFNSWIDGIKAKASAALRENKALDEQFKRSREIERELELKRQEERERLDRLIRDHVEQEKQEQDEQLEKAYQSLASATNGNAKVGISQSDSEASESVDENGVSNGFVNDNSSQEDVEEEGQTSDENEVGDVGLTTGMEHTDESDGDSYYEEEPTFAHSTRARQLHIESPESADGEDSDEDDDEQEYAEDDELTETQQIFSNDASEPLEIMSSEEEDLAESESGASNGLSASQPDMDDAEEEEGHEINSDADTSLFTDNEDDFEPQDANAFEAVAGLEPQYDVSSAETSQQEEQETAYAEYESDADADADAPEAFANEQGPSDVYDTEAKRDWLQATDKSATIEGSNEIPMAPENFYEDEAEYVEIDNVVPHEGDGPSHSQHEIPTVQPAGAHHALYSDALTEEEIEDEKYHMWKDEMAKPEVLQPITEEAEQDRIQDHAQGLAGPGDAATNHLVHSHPAAHRGHEHEHHAHTMESTTEELHVEPLPAVSTHEIEDETMRNFEVVKDVDDVVTSIRDRDTFDEPMTAADEEALAPELQFLEKLDGTVMPTAEPGHMDERQDFPDNLELDGMSEEDEPVEAESGEDGDEQDDIEDFAQDLDNPEAHWETDSEEDEGSLSDASRTGDDPEVIEDEGSIQYEEEKVDSDSSVEDVQDGSEEAGSESDLPSTVPTETHETPTPRLDMEQGGTDTADSADEGTHSVEAQEEDLVHVLRDGAEYVDDEHLRDHHYTPRLQFADAPDRHRRRHTKSPLP
ncbi:protein of unknown function [Taphrina deformans PYCC 5710]|uniref:Uncharacterized protein n=1 Tax=Taphrina deformans (strain PYCC 5710 / ATCC 11124 / CBS 356.35 / IMI 108563 / JCM 9778 / NBRC 8474) TaxID=1097556 RepID=R4XDR6_TAPDE|nr:protein of unknown function [Taphrina deformans PYCC 5710]|eukprot:CCG83975.1 protein of unknown function [Taphrina deformans PYCC 5710]